MDRDEDEQMQPTIDMDNMTLDEAMAALAALEVEQEKSAAKNAEEIGQIMSDADRAEQDFYDQRAAYDRYMWDLANGEAAS